MADYEMTDAGTMVALHNSDFDRQIATAKKFPRSMGRAKDQILAFATESEDTAQECIYALPRGGKVIKGPSARFAEIVASSWGNSRFAARIIDEGPVFVTAQGVFHDLETNTYVSLEVTRRITKANGDRYDTDMIGVTGMAAMSIALRNVILRGIPRSVWGDALAKCEVMIRGNFESLAARRTAALAEFKRQGVSDDLVLGLLEKDNVQDIAQDDLVVLRGVLSAVRDGDTTLTKVFGNGVGRREQQREKADVSGKINQGKKADDANGRAGEKAAGSAGATSAGANAGGAAAVDNGDNPPSGDGAASGGAAPSGGADGQSAASGPAEDAGASASDPADGAAAGQDGNAGAGAGANDSVDAADASGPVIELSEGVQNMLAQPWADAELAVLKGYAAAIAVAGTMGELTKIDNAWASKLDGSTEEVAATARAIRQDRSKAIRSAPKSSAATKL